MRSPKQHGAVPPKGGRKILENAEPFAQTFAIWFAAGHSKFIEHKKRIKTAGFQVLPFFIFKQSLCHLTIIPIFGYNVFSRVVLS